MANDGIVIIGDEVLGYSEREVYLYWDIATDTKSERYFTLSEPFYSFATARYATHEHILYTYITRWVTQNYIPIPCTDRSIYINYKQLEFSERNVFYYPDSAYKFCFAEGLLTNTPLLMKYPKYYNWVYIPQILNPSFQIWSFYDIDIDNVTLHIVSDSGKNIYVNSGINKDLFKIEKISEQNHLWNITIHIDEVFDNGEHVDCYLSLYDVRGNHLKDGLW